MINLQREGAVFKTVIQVDVTLNKKTHSAADLKRSSGIKDAAF